MEDTSVGFAITFIILDSSTTLDTDLWGGRCLSYVGREGKLDHPPIATDVQSFAIVDFATIEYLLGAEVAVEPWQRRLFNSEHFEKYGPIVNAADAASLKGDEATRAGSVLYHAKEALATVKHLLVFRASKVDPGKLGNSYVIEQRAQWAGWAFLVTYEPAPQLVAAIPLEATNGELISVVKGQAGALLVEIAERVRKTLASKLGTADSMADSDASACAKGDDKACLTSAQIYRTGRRYLAEAIAVTTPTAPDKALPLYAKLCDAGASATSRDDKWSAAGACLEAGRICVEGGAGVEKDRARAAALLARGCDGGQGLACTELGLLRSTADAGATADLAGAVAAFEFGCNKGDGAGCYQASLHYRAGDGVARDDFRATLLSATACSQGVTEACKGK